MTFHTDQSSVSTLCRRERRRILFIAAGIPKSPKHADSATAATTASPRSTATSPIRSKPTSKNGHTTPLTSINTDRRHNTNIEYGAPCLYRSKSHRCTSNHMPIFIDDACAARKAVAAGQGTAVKPLGS
jgi:hypothetical protein